MDNVLRFEYKKGEQEVFPCHKFVKNHLFKENEKEEASLLHYIAVVSEKNGLNSNDISHLFPAILRILKSDIEWSK